MSRRFSDLDKRAFAILANGGNPANSTDTELARYWRWRTNPSSSDRDLPAASTRTTGRRKNTIYLEPFAINLATNVLAKAQITRRSDENFTAAVKTACGHRPLGSNTAYRFAGYRPAYVYQRTGAAATSSDRVSRITGRPYKSRFAQGDQGYVAPFGKTTTMDTEGGRQQAIIAAFGGALDTRLITFTPEKYRS